MEFFTSNMTVAQVKDTFKKLVFIHHPDLGGDTETMKRLNVEFENVMSGAMRHEETKKDNNVTYAEVAAWIVAIIDQIITIPGIEIEIRGTWIWVGGNTKPVKDELSAAGMWWSGAKGEWYIKPGKMVSRRGRFTKDQIRMLHGAERVESKVTFI